jgi:hypothetical protein
LGALFVGLYPAPLCGVARSNVPMFRATKQPWQRLPDMSQA